MLGRRGRSGTEAGTGPAGLATLLAVLLLALRAGSQEEAHGTRAVEAGALRLAIPARWKEQDLGRKRSVRFRYSQFKLRTPVASTDDVRVACEIPAERKGGWLKGLFGGPPPADLVVYHFGRRGEGSDESVVRGWIQMFALKRKGVAEDRKVRIVEGRRGEGTYVLVELSGTYYYNVAHRFRVEAEFVPGARMLAAIVRTKDGPYYAMLTGRDAVVRPAIGEFRTALGLDAKSEVPLDETLQRIGATVRVRFELEGKPHPAEGLRVSLGAKEAVSSKSGATFENVEPGRLELSVDATDGFAPVPSREVEVEAGSAVEVVITLEPKG